MLKKKDLETFLMLVRPQRNMDTLWVSNLFELLRTQPRTVGELSESLNRDWANTKRFLNESRRYKGCFLYDDDTKEYSLSEDTIMHRLMDYDQDKNVVHLHLVHEKLSDGPRFDPVPQDWFTDKMPFYPWPPDMFNEDSIYGFGANPYYDPFVTLCYIFSCGGKKFRARLENKLKGEEYKFDLQHIPENTTMFHVITWSWAYLNIQRGNYAFFVRDFSYLPEKGDWTRNTNEDYGFTNTYGFIQNWLRAGPQPYRKAK